MALSVQAANRARIAMQRFGLGPKPGSLAAVADDPMAALRAELDRPELALIADPSLPTYKAACAASQNGFTAAEDVRQKELKARVDKHLAADIGFLERLVLFWSNHFSMSINKDELIRGTYGQLERDVIRPNVLGSFDFMLRGVFRHPAMLRYLDNQDSLGPNSPTGKAWGAGFNENLGRELMELHTLGSGAGYTETDVTNMALVLTGRSYVRGWEADNGWNGGSQANRGQYIFRADWHEPGAITVRGKAYPAEGATQCDRVLVDLARSRATAQHIAFKLVRHFIADEPTAALVDPVANAFYASKGDLKKTVLALIALPAAWAEPLGKIRTPYELAVAQFRAMQTVYDPNDNGWAFSEPLRAMNHLPWERPAPDGYADENYAWLDPDGMTIRLDTALLSVDVFGQNVRRTPAALGRALYDSALSTASVSSLARFPERRDGLTLLFMTPEFQRR